MKYVIDKEKLEDRYAYSVPEHRAIQAILDALVPLERPLIDNTKKCGHTGCNCGPVSSWDKDQKKLDIALTALRGALSLLEEGEDYKAGQFIEKTLAEIEGKEEMCIICQNYCPNPGHHCECKAFPNRHKAFSVNGCTCKVPCPHMRWCSRCNKPRNKCDPRNHGKDQQKPQEEPMDKFRKMVVIPICFKCGMKSYSHIYTLSSKETQREAMRMLCEEVRIDRENHVCEPQEKCKNPDCECHTDRQFEERNHCYKCGITLEDIAQHKQEKCEHDFVSITLTGIMECTKCHQRRLPKPTPLFQSFDEMFLTDGQLITPPGKALFAQSIKSFFRERIGSILDRLKMNEKHADIDIEREDGYNYAVREIDAAIDKEKELL